MEITSEQLDEIERLIVSGNPSDALELAPEPVLKIITLARQGLQLREADAEADDFAEKLNKYVRKGEHGIFETLDNLTAELEALRKDKERLDWLEKNSDLRHIYEEGRPDTTIAVIRVDKFTFDFDEINKVRAAISATMEKEKSV